MEEGGDGQRPAEINDLFWGFSRGHERFGGSHIGNLGRKQL